MTTQITKKAENILRDELDKINDKILFIHEKISLTDSAEDFGKYHDILMQLAVLKVEIIDKLCEVRVIKKDDFVQKST